MQRTEDGSALILALVFLSLFGLLIAAILGQVDANVRTTLVVRTHEAKVYGADAGIDYAIQTLQADDTLCADDTVGQETLTQPPEVSGVKVTVTCETTEGNVLGVRGYAVVTTEPKFSAGGETSIDTASGSSKRIIEGPVYIAGDLNLDKPLEIEQAYLLQASPCQSTIDDLTFNPSAPFGVKCTTEASPDEDHDLPSFPSVVQSAAGDGGSSCRTFSPGVYTTPPDLRNRNFFASGVYYFENIGRWVVESEVFGGLARPDDNEQQVLTETPCVTVDPSGPTAGGVMFIFGGDSWLHLANNGHLELFSPNAAAASSGDPGFSIRSVLATDHAADARWTVSTAATILEVTGGNTRDFSVHGLVYAPDNIVNLFATGDDVSALLQGGAKVRRLILQRSENAPGLGVSTKKGSGRRTITLTAKAIDPDGGRTIEARAVVRIQNDAARTVTVLSRSVQ